MRHWLASNAELLTNVLDLVSFLLVTPDIVGKERLARLGEWLQAHPLRLPSGQGEEFTMVAVVGAMILSVIVLASGRWLSPWMRWARTLPAPLNSLMQALNALWGGFLVFAFLPSVYTIGAGFLFLTAELLRLTVVKWEISGVMLVVGAVMFACSRSLAIWRSLNKDA